MTFAEKHRIDQIVLAFGEKASPRLTKDILSARLKGIEVIDMPDIYQTIKRRIPINYVDENWFLTNKQKAIEIPVEVPVTVFEALINSKIIEDPFYGLKEHEVSWVYESE